MVTRIVKRYPTRARALQRVDLAERQLDDLERRISLRSSVCGTSGMIGSGVLRLWIGDANRLARDGMDLNNKTSSAPLPMRKRARSSLGDGSWEICVEGALVDDGWGGKSMQGLDSLGPHFSKLVTKVEIALDKRQGKGLVLTWLPSLDCTKLVNGLVLRRFYSQGPRYCHVRLAVSLNSVPRQFKLSPILARIVKVNHEMSKDKIVAAITRYIDRRQLRDPRDGRSNAIQCFKHVSMSKCSLFPSSMSCSCPTFPIQIQYI